MTRLTYTPDAGRVLTDIYQDMGRTLLEIFSDWDENEGINGGDLVDVINGHFDENGTFEDNPDWEGDDGTI
jgi:hypothetical protein